MAITCSTADGLAWSIVLPDYGFGDGTGDCPVVPTPPPPQGGPSFTVKEEKRRERGAKEREDKEKRG